MRKQGLTCIFGMIFIMLLSGCGNQKNNVTGSMENSVKTDVEDSMTDSSDTEKADNAEIVECGKKETAKYLLQMDINPSFIIGCDENNTVVYLSSNNTDAYQLLREKDKQEIIGFNLEDGISEILKTIHEARYEENTYDVEIKFVSEEKTDTGDILQAVRQAVKKCDFSIMASVEKEALIKYSPDTGIEEWGLLSSEDSQNGGTEEGQTKEITDITQNQEKDSGNRIDSEKNQGEQPKEQIEEPNNEWHTCDLCNGSGRYTCEICDGKGTVIEIEQTPREIEVRNDYVCPTCGGKGWIDDGMHGGEIAECGYCTTNGGCGEFRERAYDIIKIFEEVENPCYRCGGSGEALCARCDGSGKIK